MPSPTGLSRLDTATGDIVTNDTYRYPVLGLDTSACMIEQRSGSMQSVAGKEDFPVVTVSWYGAVIYANWLSEKNGFDACYNASYQLISPVPSGFRLPTEAEWERAAGWDSSRDDLWDDFLENTGWMYIYPVSADSMTADDANVNGSAPKAIGSYDGVTSPVGCLDMAGNVAEWCHDWYAVRYDTTATADPTGAASGTSRVVRGGSFSSGVSAARSTVRDKKAPGDYFSTVGFRVARYNDESE